MAPRKLSRPTATAVMALALPPMPSCSLASGSHRMRPGMRRCSTALYSAGVAWRADHIQTRDQLLRLGGRLEALHEQRRTRRLLALGLTLVAQRLHDQQFAVALGQVIVQRGQHLGRQAVVARAAEDQLLAPLDDLFAQGAHEANQIGTRLDHIGAADGFDACLGAVLADGHA